jgi:hypothetical protein
LTFLSTVVSQVISSLHVYRLKFCMRYSYSICVLRVPPLSTRTSLSLHFSSLSCYSLVLRAKYSSPHFVLMHSQSLFCVKLGHRNPPKTVETCAEIKKNKRIPNVTGEITYILSGRLTVSHFIQRLSAFYWASLMHLNTKRCALLILA